MSIDYSAYKNKLKEKKLPKFIEATGIELPPEISNLSQYTDTLNRDYFPYYNYNGGTCFYVRRKEASENKNGKKIFYAFSYGEDGKWHKLSWPNNRCLYNEHLLKTHQDKPVLISEGEKAAAYGSKNFSDYVHVAWSGGSKAVSKTNFQHLKDREVILFPDNDPDGIRAMVHVAKTLIDEDITDNIRIVEVEELPQGFDIADAPMHQEINVPGYIKKAVEFDPDTYIKELKAIQTSEDKKSIEFRYSAQILPSNPVQDPGKLGVDATLQQQSYVSNIASPGHNAFNIPSLGLIQFPTLELNIQLFIACSTESAVSQYLGE